MNAQLERRQDVFSRGGNRTRYGRLVSGAEHLQRARLGVRQDALTVHYDLITLGEEAEMLRLAGRGRYFGHADGLEGALHGFHHLDRLAAAVGPDRTSGVDRAQ